MLVDAAKGLEPQTRKLFEVRIETTAEFAASRSSNGIMSAGALQSVPRPI